MQGEHLLTSGCLCVDLESVVNSISKHLSSGQTVRMARNEKLGNRFVSLHVHAKSLIKETSI